MDNVQDIINAEGRDAFERSKKKMAFLELIWLLVVLFLMIEAL